MLRRLLLTKTRLSNNLGDVNSFQAKHPSGSANSTPTLANDPNADKSLDATLAREDALLQQALDKEALSQEAGPGAKPAQVQL